MPTRINSTRPWTGCSSARRRSTHEACPGERLIACRNPPLARLRGEKRQDLIAATVRELDKVAAIVVAGRLKATDRIGCPGRQGGRQGDWDDGALLLEQNDEWAVQRRYMSLDTHETLSDDPQAKLTRIVAATACAIVEFRPSPPPIDQRRGHDPRSNRLMSDINSRVSRRPCPPAFLSSIRASRIIRGTITITAAQ
jgi:hypothetical protein